MRLLAEGGWSSACTEETTGLLHWESSEWMSRLVEVVIAGSWTSGCMASGGESDASFCWCGRPVVCKATASGPGTELPGALVMSSGVGTDFSVAIWIVMSGEEIVIVLEMISSFFCSSGGRSGGVLDVSSSSQGLGSRVCCLVSGKGTVVNWS